GIGQKAQREHDVVDTVLGQVADDELDHRPVDDRQHLLGAGTGERTQPRAEPPDQHDSAHYPSGGVSAVVSAGASGSPATVVSVPSPGSVVDVSPSSCSSSSLAGVPASAAPSSA